VATPGVLAKYRDKILAPFISRINYFKKERESILKKLKQVEKMKVQPGEREASVYVILNNLLKTELSGNERKTSDIHKDIVRIKDPKFGMVTGHITADRFYSETTLALGVGARKITGFKERVRYSVKNSYIFSELLDKKES